MSDAELQALSQLVSTEQMEREVQCEFCRSKGESTDWAVVQPWLNRDLLQTELRRRWVAV